MAPLKSATGLTMGANVLYSGATTDHVSLILSRIIELEIIVSLIRKFVMNRITPFYHEL